MHGIDFMKLALQNARLAAQQGEVPVAALIASSSGEILANTQNRIERDNNPIAHAEMLAIEKAARQKKNWRLNDCDMFVTLEPCAMCAAAIVQARLRRLYFAAFDTKAGAVANGPAIIHNAKNIHAVEVYGGIKESEAQKILLEFFQAVRNKNRNEKVALTKLHKNRTDIISRQSK